ncbi:hypothetical protein [Limisphaera sp. 4302-co]|uniref:hypothetical protein n=1 Tax=Limisphaera sp. 4302-co TaxID=3400417 RepID=UPI003C24E0F3
MCFAAAAIRGPEPLCPELHPGFIRGFCRTPERLLVLELHLFYHAMWGPLGPGPLDREETGPPPHGRGGVDALITADFGYKLWEERLISFYRDFHFQGRFPDCWL